MSQTVSPGAIDLHTVLDNLADPLFLCTGAGEIVDVNPRACDALGQPREALLGQHLSTLTPRGSPEWWQTTAAAYEPITTQGAFLRASGDSFQAEIRASIISTQDDRRLLLATARDITDRLRLEAQLRQATKMEAVGRLAGGVAHDFNNLLTVILTYSRFLQEDLGPDNAMTPDVQEVEQAARRASALTQRLLAFSRRQVMEPELLDWTKVTMDLVSLLRRLIGEDVQLITDLDTDPSMFVGDPGQLSQVVMNLVVNARDAMPKGGTVSLTTRDIEVDQLYASRLPGMRPGEYACLEVHDTGCGMDETTLNKLFEPFFTTKVEGTGLGLAMVYGIVKQCNGFIYVDSSPKKGSVFRVFMPIASGRVRAGARPAPLFTNSPLGGDECILLVEDDDLVRNVATRSLGRSGYKVLAASNAGEALLLFERHRNQIDLLVTDVVMPHMSGPELAKRLQQQAPELPVLFITGYTNDALVRHGLLDPRMRLLHKPFTPDRLVGHVRQSLDACIPSSVPPRPIEVLVVDDDRVLRRAIRRVLHGVKVSEAASVQEAECLLDNGEWDLVLCDVMLSDGTALDLAKWVDEERPDLNDRLVFMTGGPDQEVMDVLMERGVDVLRKPIDPSQLRALVRALGAPASLA